MADEKLGTFDLQEFIQADMPGAKFAGPGSSPGTIKVIVPSGVKDEATGTYRPDIEVDLNAMLKADGIDPAQVDIKYNDESTAVEDSPLGFIDRMKYEVARKPSDKAKFLKDRFGADNMRFDPTTSRFKVNQNGVWYDADSTGIAGFLGGEGDVITGAVAGGAAATSAVAPYAAAVTAMSGGVAGPVAGAALVGAGALGAGVGAVVARFSSMKAAEAAGLRTEQDASETAAELAKEGILAMAGEVALPLVKLGAKATARKMTSAVSKMAEQATTPAAKRELAYTMENLTDVPFVDNQTWLDNPLQVEAHQRKLIDWEEKGSLGYNPVKKEMADSVQEVVTTVRKNMDEAYRAEDARLEPIIKGLEVDVSPIHQSVLGMVNDLEAEISNIADKTSQRHMRSVIDVVKRAVRDDAPKAMQAKGQLVTKQVEKEGLDMYGTRTVNKEMQSEMVGAKGPTAPAIEVDWKTGGQKSRLRTSLEISDARKLLGNLDDILETAGQYNIGPREISTRAKARILNLRSMLSEAIIGTVEKKNPQAAAQYRAMNERYSGLREWVDDVAIGTRDERIDSTVKRLLGNDGGRNVDNMKEALAIVGVDGDKFINGLFQRRAAVNSTKIYKSKGIGNLALGQMRITSPQRTTPLVAKTFNKLQGVAQMNNFVNDLKPQARRALLSNPDMLRAVRQITLQAIQGANEGTDALVQQALEASNPQPTPLLPPDEKTK